MQFLSPFIPTPILYKILLNRCKLGTFLSHSGQYAVELMLKTKLAMQWYLHLYQEGWAWIWFYWINVELYKTLCTGIVLFAWKHLDCQAMQGLLKTICWDLSKVFIIEGEIIFINLQTIFSNVCRNLFWISSFVMSALHRGWNILWEFDSRSFELNMTKQNVWTLLCYNLL